VRLTLAALLLVPLLEIIGIILVSREVGGWATFLLIVLAAGIGLLLVTRAGVRAWRALRTDVQEGVVPGRTVGDPVLVLLGGLLLVFPGFLTDVIGLLLVMPWTRPLARAWFRAVVGRRMPAGVVPGQPPPGMPDRHRDRDVIEGEIVHEEPPPPGRSDGPPSPGPQNGSSPGAGPR
jgi:UPF0716 protein FxsA